MAPTARPAPAAPRRWRLGEAARTPLLVALGALVVGAAASSPDSARSESWNDQDAADASGPQRRLDIDINDLLSSTRMHTSYTFNLTRRDMKRQGSGELWFSFAKKLPRMRWRGAAHSPKFGEGQITVVVDPERRVMYTNFQLAELHNKQCLIYPFPKLDRKTNEERLEVIEKRKEHARHWEQDFKQLEAGDMSKAVRLMYLQWSKKTALEFKLGKGGKAITGMQTKRGNRVIKTIEFPEGVGGGPDADFDDDGIFGPPAEGCRPVGSVDYPYALLELQLPHKRSSALNDLLLVLMDMETNPGDWPRLFLLLSALMVPGDVAVMIEDPKPPDLGKLHSIAFEYHAAVMSHGTRHASGGSIWLDLAARSLRLRGEAKQTKVGPLYMDLIAHGGEEAQVFANVNLTVEEEHQCVAYDYPSLPKDLAEEVKRNARQGMRFYAISSLHGDDCEIFEAPIARGRWIHIWVDLESDTPDAVLRSEVHRHGQVIRSTEVFKWQIDADLGSALNPAPSWGCGRDHKSGQLAHLGLHQVHQRSVELQDTLYALRELDREFAVLEVLGLTGDVAIMIQEPEAPALWGLSGVSFQFSFSPPPTELPAGSHRMTGSVAVNHAHGVSVMVARDADSDTTIRVYSDLARVSVLLEEADRKECLTMPFTDHGGDASLPERIPATAKGVFGGVERVNEAHCNRFSFLGEGPHAEGVEMWYSNEEDAMCRLSLRPPDSDMELWGLVDISSWKTEFVIQPPAGGDPDPSNWGCRPAKELGDASWLSFSPKEPADMLPSASLLAKIAKAASVIGLMPPAVANKLAHIAVVKPPKVQTTTTPPQVSIFSPDLASFGFAYTSTFPLQSVGLSAPVRDTPGELGPSRRHRGVGRVHVDLVGRKLFLRSKAYNVSYSIPELDTRIIYRGDRGLLYAYVRVDGGHGGDMSDFEQCWDISTGEAFPPPPGGGRSPNPFLGAHPSEAGRFSVPGHDGDLARKHIMFPSQSKRMQLFVTESTGSLVAINLDDLIHHVSTGIVVEEWSTAPHDPSVFEPTAEWRCESSQSVQDLQHLAHWDLLRMFFPAAAPVTASEEDHRRLFSV